MLAIQPTIPFSDDDNPTNHNYHIYEIIDQRVNDAKTLFHTQVLELKAKANHQSLYSTYRQSLYLFKQQHEWARDLILLSNSLMHDFPRTTWSFLLAAAPFRKALQAQSHFNEFFTTLCKKLRFFADMVHGCLLYTSPSPRDGLLSRMPSSA